MPRFHDNQLPTPYFGGKKGEALPPRRLSPSKDFK